MLSLSLLFSLKGECHGPDGQPGYGHVRKLAAALVEARDLPGLSDRRVDRLTELWHRLPESDKRHLLYPARHQERLVRGRFNTSKVPGVAGKESLEQYVFSFCHTHF